MSELLPCPFCGGEATIEVKTEWYDYDGGDRWWIYQADVTCDSCDAMMHVNHYKPKEFTDWATAEQFAIAAWNTRAERVTVYPDGEHGITVCGKTYVPERTCHYKEHDALVMLSCDVCGHGSLYRPNYCPNCGAKVVGE